MDSSFSVIGGHTVGKVQTQKPILTISLLSSNRRDTIRKCLDSLKTLRERVPSELIIVDTSQNEEMKKILEEYTDKIIPFTWCNDFSKARNVGLDAAKGEWFLYLDDDEWFIDTIEIEEFFLSGDYKEYTLAYYLQRNYSDYAGTNFQDARVSRMFRIWNQIHFASSIHEYPDPITGKTKLLHSVVEHYGYVYDTEEKRYQHFWRNVTLLQDMIQKERKNSRWWLQLLQEYRNIGQLPEMARCCEEAISIFEKEKDPFSQIAMGSFYNAILFKHLGLFEYEQAEEMLKKALANKNITKMCRAALYASAVCLYFHKEEYALCEEYSSKYFALYEEFKDKEEEQYKQGYFFVEDAFSQAHREQVSCLFIMCGLKRDDASALKTYFWTLNWEGRMLFLETDFIEQVVDAFGRLPYEEEFVRMAETMVKRDSIAEVIMRCLEKKEHAAAEDFDRLRRIFLQIDSRLPYLLYLKLSEITESAALKAFMKAVTFFEWKVAVDRFCMQAAPDTVIQLGRLPTEGGREFAGSRSEYFFLKDAEVALGRCSLEDYEELQAHIACFCEKNLTFYHRFFKSSAFSGEMEMLPVQGRAAVMLQRALDAQSEGDIKAVSAALKESIKIYPPITNVVRAYTELFAARQKARMNEQKRTEQQESLMVSAQMQQLGAQIKKKIRQLLEQGMAAEALQTLEQLKTFLPEDTELEGLEKEIRGRMS
jgi:glycosyltransferase involved in cell wall biosynthesis